MIWTSIAWHLQSHSSCHMPNTESGHWGERSVDVMGNLAGVLWAQRLAIVVTRAGAVGRVPCGGGYNPLHSKEDPQVASGWGGGTTSRRECDAVTSIRGRLICGTDQRRVSRPLDDKSVDFSKNPYLRDGSQTVFAASQTRDTSLVIKLMGCFGARTVDYFTQFCEL